MNRSIITVFLASVLCALAISSCSSQKTVLPYFADIPKGADGTVEAGNYLPTIKPDDELLITVTSLDPVATAAYNLPAYNVGTDMNITERTKELSPITALGSMMQLQTYIVNSAGDIFFPVLGKIHVADMNVEQLQAYLT